MFFISNIQINTNPIINRAGPERLHGLSLVEWLEHQVDQYLFVNLLYVRHEDA